MPPDEPTEETPSSDQAPAPSPVRLAQEDLKALGDSIAAGVSSAISNLPQPTPVAPAPEPAQRERVRIEEIDREIQAARDEDREPRIAPLIQRAAEDMVSDIVQATERRISGNDAAMQEMAEAVAKQNMPHYDRFKTEIAATLNSLPANLRGQISSIREAYNLVVGRHANELLQEAEQRALQASRDDPDTSPPSGISSRSAGGGPAPTSGEAPRTIEARFGADSKAALDDLCSRNGMSYDQFAQKMGFKDVNDWLDSQAEMMKRVQAGDESFGLDR